MTRSPTCLAAVAALALACAPAPSRAETVNCTPITSLPATLATQGVYCLTQDLSTALSSGNAITIATNNVTIDCNGFKLGGLPAGIGTQATGIRAENRLNAVIRNCTVRGFAYGIFVDGGGHVVEGNRLDGNTRIGVLLFGDGGVVRDNRIFDTGGSPPSTVPYIGVYTIDGVDIEDNTVSGVTATPGSGKFAAGIYTFGNANGALDRSRIRGVVGDGAAGSFGALNVNSSQMVITHNQLVGDGTGIGLQCDSALTVAAGNHVLGFATSLANCLDVSGNLID